MNWKKTLLFFYWVPAIVWMVAIFNFSSQAPEEIPAAGKFLPDYITHAAEYFLLALLLFVALMRTWLLRFVAAFGLILGWCLLYGLGNELYQLHVIDRHFSLWDVLADGVGAVLFLLLVTALQRAGSRGEQIYWLLAGGSRGR